MPTLSILARPDRRQTPATEWKGNRVADTERPRAAEGRFASSQLAWSPCRWMVLAIAGLTLQPIAWSASYYVSPNGNDSRSANQARNRNTPWRNVERAMQRINPGDEVVMLAGTYNQDIWIRNGGRENAPIRLRAEFREAARVLGYVYCDNQSHVVVDGLDVTNTRSSGFTKGIQFYLCHHVTVRSCRVRDCYGAGISFDRCDWILAEWNVSHGNAFFDVAQHSGINVYQPYRLAGGSDDYGVVIRNNTSYGNANFANSLLFGKPTDGNGIIVDDTTNVQDGGRGEYGRPILIENNICYSNGGNGIHTYLSSNLTIRNNTCVANRFNVDFGGDISVSRSRNVAVYNNVAIARSGSTNAMLQYEGEGNFFFRNLINGPVRDVPFDGSSFYGDPNFLPNTFTPSGGSVLVDAGFDGGDHFPVDSQGSPRFIGALDIGAVEAVR